METRTYTNGWSVVLAGAVLLVIGLALVGLCLFFVFGVPTDDMPLALRAGIVTAAVLPLVVAVIGGWLMFAGDRTTIDPRDRTVRVRRGLLIPWQTEVHRADAFERVAFRLIVSSGVADSDPGNASSSYPIRLEGPGVELEVCGPGRYASARRIAEQIATGLHLPLLDATLPESIERAPDLLDETVAQRLQRTGVRPSWPKLPSSSRIRFDHLGDEVTIDQPPVRGPELRNNLIGVGILLALWTAGAYPAAHFMRGWVGRSTEAGWPQVAQAVIAALPFIPIVFVACGTILFVVVRERVIVSPRRLRREWLLPLGRWSRELPAADIEQLAEDGDDIIVRTDRASLRVGLMLAGKERRWLKSAIECGLTGQRPT